MAAQDGTFVYAAIVPSQFDGGARMNSGTAAFGSVTGCHGTVTDRERGDLRSLIDEHHSLCLDFPE